MSTVHVDNCVGREVRSMKLNVLLFLYLLVNTIIDLSFDPIEAPVTPWDKFYDAHQWLAIGSACIVLVVLIVWGVYLVRTFWNTFMVKKFRFEAIDVGDAISVTLVLALLF